MKPKDLMVMTVDCAILDQVPGVGGHRLPAGGLRGDVVVFIGRTDYYPIVKVLHSVHGICETYAHNLEAINESR